MFVIWYHRYNTCSENHVWKHPDELPHLTANNLIIYMYISQISYIISWSITASNISKTIFLGLKQPRHFLQSEGELVNDEQSTQISLFKYFLTNAKCLFRLMLFNNQQTAHDVQETWYPFNIDSFPHVRASWRRKSKLIRITNFWRKTSNFREKISTSRHHIIFKLNAYCKLI